MTHGHLASLASLFCLAVVPAHATGALSCDGNLSFIDGANTVIPCSGDLRIDEGNLLSADDALWLSSDTRISVLDATRIAPTLTLQAPQIEILGRLIATDGGITLRAHGGSWGQAETLRISAGAVLSVAGIDAVARTSDVTYVSNGGGVELRSGAVTLEALPGGTIVVASPVPEPAPWALFLGGFGLVGVITRRCGGSGARAWYAPA